MTEHKKTRTNKDEMSTEKEKCQHDGGQRTKLHEMTRERKRDYYYAETRPSICLGHQTGSDIN